LQLFTQTTKFKCDKFIVVKNILHLILRRIQGEIVKKSTC
jgi:hypothetical protein